MDPEWAAVDLMKPFLAIEATFGVINKKILILDWGDPPTTLRHER
jgi:hypothetical protein